MVLDTMKYKDNAGSDKMTNLAAKAFIVKGNRIFIVKRSANTGQYPYIWEFPGGRINQGENPFAGLKREIKEETNLDIEIGDPFIVDHFTRVDGQLITMITFVCKALNNEVKLSKEHTDYDWLDLNCDVKKSKLYDFFHKYVIAYNRIFGTK